MRFLPIRIAFFLRSDKDEISGGRLHAYLMAQALGLIGHDVVVYTNCLSSILEVLKENYNYLNFRLEISERYFFSQNNILYDWVVVVPHGFSHRKDDSTLFEQAKEVKMASKSKMVILNFESDNWYNTYSPVKRPKTFSTYFNQCLNHGDIILSSCFESQKYLKEYLNEKNYMGKLLVCYPGVLFLKNVKEKYIDFDNKRKKSILIPLRLNSVHKGKDCLDYFIQERFDGIILNILIGGKKPSNLFISEKIKKAESLNIELNIYHQISERKKTELYIETDLVVFPSLFEGFGLPPIEAYIHETPCLSFDLPCLQEINGENLNYVTWGDFSSMAEKALEIINQSRCYKPTIDQSRVNFFKIDAYAKRLNDIFEQNCDKESLNQSYILNKDKKCEPVNPNLEELSLKISRRSNSDPQDYYIFGAGSAGQKVLTKLEELNIELASISFVDNNSSLWGGSISGKLIYPPDKLKEKPKARIIIASIYRESILKQISDMGLEVVRCL